MLFVLDLNAMFRGYFFCPITFFTLFSIHPNKLFGFEGNSFIYLLQRKPMKMGKINMNGKNIEILGIFRNFNVENNTFGKGSSYRNGFTLCIGSMIWLSGCIPHSGNKAYDDVGRSQSVFAMTCISKWIHRNFLMSLFKLIFSHGIEIENSTFSINSMRLSPRLLSLTLPFFLSISFHCSFSNMENISIKLKRLHVNKKITHGLL